MSTIIGVSCVPAGTAGVLDHFGVVFSEDEAEAGVPTTFTVTAYDYFGNILQGYRGTVEFTSDDPAATLPGDYTFTAGDDGVHTFTNGVTFETSGDQDVTVNDTVETAATGTADIPVVAGPAASFTVTGLVSQSADLIQSDCIVTALDQFGNVATGYVGTIEFSSNDPGAVLPADYTFLAGDNGVHNFEDEVQLVTVGSRTVTVDDTVDPDIDGTSAAVTVSVGILASFTVAGITDPIEVGETSDVTVTAKDAHGNTKTDIAAEGASQKTIAFTSTDGSATLPSNYVFVGGDAGVKTFAAGVAFATAGTQSVTATNLAATATGSQTGIDVTQIDPFADPDLLFALVDPATTSDESGDGTPVSDWEAINIPGSSAVAALLLRPAFVAASNRLSFDGTANQMDLDAFKSMLVNKGNVTIFAALKPSALGANQKILVATNADFTNYLELRLKNTDNFYSDDTRGGAAATNSFSQTLAATTELHLCCWVLGQGVVPKFSLDNDTPVAGLNASDNSPMGDFATYMKLGGNGFDWFAGELAFIAVYARAFTQPEIAQFAEAFNNNQDYGTDGGDSAW